MIDFAARASSDPEFRLEAYRFIFRAREGVRFPAGKAGNVFRGAFGTVLRRAACRADCEGAALCPDRAECAYARLFAPKLQGGPSGLADPPRPFVLRAAHLDGTAVAAGERFTLDVHVFDAEAAALKNLTLAFLLLAQEGVGARRGRVQLEEVRAVGVDREAGAVVFDGAAVALRGNVESIVLGLAAGKEAVGRVRVRLLTPTDLKGGGEDGGLPFGLLFARLRDRVSTLRALYGGGPLKIDFAGMGERARHVETVRSGLRRVEVARRSSRSGAVHGLGGMVGEVEYEGELGEFMPYLEAGYWVGVGRHTVWGCGVVEVEREG